MLANIHFFSVPFWLRLVGVIFMSSSCSYSRSINTNRKIVIEKVMEWTREPCVFWNHNNFTIFGEFCEFHWVAGSSITSHQTVNPYPNGKIMKDSLLIIGTKWSFSHLNFIKFAKDWMRQLEARGFQPDITSFNALISGYAQMADVDGALESFNTMIQRKISPNSVSYKVVTWHWQFAGGVRLHVVPLHWSGFLCLIQADLLCGPFLGGTHLKKRKKEIHQELKVVSNSIAIANATS